MEGFVNLIVAITDALRKGQPVVIHCKECLGRTGLVAAAVIVAMAGLTPQEAITAVRKTRMGAIETRQQAEFIEVFHRSHLRGRPRLENQKAKRDN